MPHQLQASESPKNLHASLADFPALRASCPAMDSGEREPFGNAVLRCERATSEKFPRSKLQSVQAERLPKKALHVTIRRMHVWLCSLGAEFSAPFHGLSTRRIAEILHSLPARRMVFCRALPESIILIIAELPQKRPCFTAFVPLYSQSVEARGPGKCGLQRLLEVRRI